METKPENFLWYAMIHFDGPYVDGYITMAPDAEGARKKILHDLILAKRVLKIEIEELSAKGRDTYYKKKDLNNVRSHIRCFRRYWRVTSRGDEVLKIKQLENTTQAGYWLNDLLLGGHHCNIPSQTVSFATRQKIAGAVTN